MSEYIYRFRPIKSLLGFKELQNQSIYFAPPSDLNDPLEDYKDIFWEGDEILWRNLFKNYLLCLQHCYFLIRLGGEETPLTTEDIPVFTSIENLPTEMYKTKMKNLLKLFFDKRQIQILIKGLSSRGKVRRNELLMYLESIHFFCIQIIQLNDETLMQSEKNKVNIDTLLNGKMFEENYFELFKSLKDELKNSNLSESVFFDVANHSASQMKLLAVLNSGDIGKNRDFYLTSFPKKYLNQLEKLMFWPWYTSCFTKNPDNSSMWGYYTEGHKGVCLKFKTTFQHGKRGIFLNTVTSYSSSKNDPEVAKHYGERFYELHDINYEAKVKSVDFFKTIGRLPYSTLISQWYCDENNQQSPLVTDVLQGQETWRKKYWETFYANIPIKTKEWRHEEESRLIHIDSLANEITKDDRVLNYDFNDLEGLIFGINSSDEDKISIIKIVHEICMERNRLDFKFYQATYDNDGGKIQINELSLIKFKK